MLLVVEDYLLELKIKILKIWIVGIRLKKGDVIV